MPNIVVQSEWEAGNSIAGGWPTHVLSLVPIEAETSGINHLIVLFDDLHSTGQPDAPSLGQIERILTWSIGLSPDDRVIVHCQMGVSRSTAVAIGILIQHGSSIPDAFRIVEQMRPFLHPNKLIIDLIDRLLLLDGALSSYFSIWLSDHQARLTANPPKRIIPL